MQIVSGFQVNIWLRVIVKKRKNKKKNKKTECGSNAMYACIIKPYETRKNQFNKIC